MTAAQPATVLSYATLAALKAIPTQTLIDGLWVIGWPMSMIEGARPLQAGQNMAGRAVTLRFVPHRPDLAADKPKGSDSGEYLAFELCGPGEALVIDAMRWPYSSIGGDIKFYRPLPARSRWAGNRRRRAGYQHAEGIRLPGVLRQRHRQTRPRRVLALAGERLHPVRRCAGAPGGCNRRRR